jgi:hypothetical protein
MKLSSDTVFNYVAKMVPNLLVYHCLIKAWAYATTGEYSDTDASEITMDEVIRRWESRYK